MVYVLYWKVYVHSLCALCTMYFIPSNWWDKYSIGIKRKCLEIPTESLLEHFTIKQIHGFSTELAKLSKVGTKFERYQIKFVALQVQVCACSCG